MVVAAAVAPLGGILAALAAGDVAHGYGDRCRYVLIYFKVAKGCVGGLSCKKLVCVRPCVLGSIYTLVSGRKTQYLLGSMVLEYVLKSERRLERLRPIQHRV